MSEKNTYLNLLEESFPGFKANIARCKALGYFWNSRPFFKEEKGEILSHVGFLKYPMLIEGKWLKVGALHAICTKTSHRGQGLASTLIHEVLKWAKDQYECVILFTEIPKFYEKLGFQSVQEYRFHLSCKRPKGSYPLYPVTSPKDHALFKSCFQNRSALSNRLWVRDNGLITAFNALFSAHPTFWSLYYSPILHGMLSFELEDKTLHLFDVIAGKLPSLDQILDHLPSEIEEIYFYFSPDHLAHAAIPEPYLYDNGHLLVHGNLPNVGPFMIPPLTRC